MAERVNTLPPDLLSGVQIIHSRVRDLESGKKKVLVLHDLPLDPESAHLANGGWERFDKLVFVSNWQQSAYNTFLGVPYSAGVVIPNAAEPFQQVVRESNVINLIYFSTPHRGLEILVPVYEALSQEFGSHIHLTVASSFGLYGWSERDAPYRHLFDKLQAMERATYLGAIPNEHIRVLLPTQDILAYPSIWPETSCLVLIESMMAGLTCVHSSLAALPETSMGLTHMYGFTEDIQDHAQRFYVNLRGAILNQMNLGFRGITVPTQQTTALVNQKYSWSNRKSDWISLLTSI